MTNAIKLYDYQEEVCLQIRENIIKRNKHILVQLPTGGGKTVIFSFIALNAASKGNKVLIITDREELLSQAGKTIKKFELNPFFIKAGIKYVDNRKNVFIAMSQTLRNRVKDQNWVNFIQEQIDIVIIDEAHIQEFNYLFENRVLDGVLTLGFTATPKRSGKMRQLGLDYDALIRGAEPKDLIQKGFLLNCDLYENESPDMAGVKINSLNGDFNEQSMFERYDKPKLYQGLLNNYKDKCLGKRMIVFCCNIEHAIKTTIQLNDAGINAKFVCAELGIPKKPEENLKDDDEARTAKISQYNERVRKYNFYKQNFHRYSGERNSVIKSYQNKEFEVIVNVDMLTKGFDDPSTEVVAICRATQSVPLWLQMLGRAARIYPDGNKTHFVVLDFGGNKKRLGGYDVNREWSLWHETGSKGGGVPPMKECGHDSKGRSLKSANEVEKGCRRLIMAMYAICPFCGYKYQEKAEAKEVDLELSKVGDENMAVIIKSKSLSKMDFEELTAYRKAKNHKSAWLWRQLWLRGKEKTIVEYAIKYNWNEQTKIKALNYCKNNF